MDFKVGNALRETCGNAWVNRTPHKFVIRVYAKAIMAPEILFSHNLV